MSANLPPTAKRVFHGEIFDVYQWPQKMFDGRTATFERLVRRPTVDVIALMDGKIITFVQEQPLRAPYPSLAGGAIEEGEEPLAAAKRELLEESGCVSGEWEEFALYHGTSKIIYEEHVYVARNCRRVQEQQLDGGEKLTERLAGFDEFLQLARIPEFAVPLNLKFAMYEALLDKKKKAMLKRRIFGAQS